MLHTRTLKQSHQNPDFQHMNLLKFIQAIAPSFPITQSLGPRAAHSMEQEDSQEFPEKLLDTVPWAETLLSQQLRLSPCSPEAAGW